MSEKVYIYTFYITTKVKHKFATGRDEQGNIKPQAIRGLAQARATPLGVTT